MFEARFYGGLGGDGFRISNCGIGFAFASAVDPKEDSLLIAEDLSDVLTGGGRLARA